MMMMMRFIKVNIKKKIYYISHIYFSTTKMNEQEEDFQV